MSEFTLHTIDSAPQQAKSSLQNAAKGFGFVPNLLAVFAESPAVLDGYLSLHQLFEKSSFTPQQRQIILLSISRYHDCNYCLAAHGTVAKMQKVPDPVINAVFYKQTIDDPQLEVLRNFTQNLVAKRGAVHKKDLQEFYQAGFSKQNVLEVVLAISFKTLSNYVNEINDTVIDDQFIKGLPDAGRISEQQRTAA